MDLIVFCVALLVIVFVYLLITWRTEDRVTRLVNKLPGPPRLPLFGTTYILALIPKRIFFRFSLYGLRKYNRIFRTWLGDIPVVNFMTPDYAEIILNSSRHISKSDIYKYLHPWLGEGLLTSTGEKWHQHRKLITPTFHFKILNNFMEVIIEKSRLLSELLVKEADGQVFDVYPYISRCTLDIICETAMGVQVNAMSEEDNKYVQSVYRISDATQNRMISGWLHPDFIFYKTTGGKQYKQHLGVLHSFTEKVIRDRKASLRQDAKSTRSTQDDDDNVSLGGKKRMAFLDLLLEVSENGTVLTDDEIREEVDTFMFEGHDTTTAGICWSLFLLGNHPEIQEQVHQEIDLVFQGERKDLTLVDLGDLKLLERCIKESLRLYPSVPIIGRLLCEDLKIEDYLLPAGCTINLHLFAIHRDERFYPDPERFDPDRFLPENTKDRHPFAYLPFSAGSRNCIGQKFAMYEEKCILAYLLRKFRVRAVQNEKSIRPSIELVLKPLDGLKITLERRH